MNLQGRYDLEVERDRLIDTLEEISRGKAPTTRQSQRGSNPCRHLERVI